MKTGDEQLIERYFDAFNRHDIDGVMACFDDDAVVIGSSGQRVEGRDAVQRFYEDQFRWSPDGVCDLRTAVARDGHGVAESLFHGSLRDGGSIQAIGAEIIEFADGKIREIRDYHRPVSEQF